MTKPKITASADAMIVAKLGEAQKMARDFQQKAAEAHKWDQRDHFASIAMDIDAIIRDITAA